MAEDYFTINKDYEQSYKQPVFGANGLNTNAMVASKDSPTGIDFTDEELEARNEEDRRFSNPTFLEGMQDTISDFDFSSMGLGSIADMFKSPAGGGASAAMNLANIGMDGFRTWDKYKTNETNRKLANQQIDNNNTVMANNAWNKNKLGTGFGVSNYGS